MRTVGTPWSHVQETGTVFDQMREKFHDSTVYTAINDRSPTHPPPVVHIAKPDHTIESLDKTAKLMIVQEVLSNRRLEETIIIEESSMPRHHSCDLVREPVSGVRVSAGECVSHCIGEC